MTKHYRCAWCNSSNTYFKYIQCWEEDRFGNTIEVDSEEEADEKGVTPKDELWHCRECDDGFLVEIEE